jgi:hypothetical protein
MTKPAVKRRAKNAGAEGKAAPAQGEPNFLPVPPPGPRTKAAIAEASQRYDARRLRVSLAASGEGNTLVIDPSHADRLGWQNQLLDAFGTPSQEFTNFALRQLANALNERGTRIDAERLNAGLAIVDGLRPENETEALLAVQMVAAHNTAMECLERARRAETLLQFESNGNMANKLLRTFSVQMETLSRIRRGGKQNVVVEHVHVHAGGKAAVGAFIQNRGGAEGESLPLDGLSTPASSVLIEED